LALGLTAVATSTAPSAAAASSSLTKAAVSKVAVAVLVIGVVAVPVWRYLDRHASGSPLAQAPVTAALVSTTPSTAITAPAWLQELRDEVESKSSKFGFSTNLVLGTHFFSFSLTSRNFEQTGIYFQKSKKKDRSIKIKLSYIILNLATSIII